MLTGWYTTRLQLRVVAHLDVADQRKVLAERMADEAVVGQHAAQIRVAAEQYAEQIERLALEPVGAGPDAGDRVDHRVLDLLAPHAQPQALIVA